jgi:gas vesicle protein
MEEGTMVKNILKTVGILSVGAGIGAGVALLYAPQTGRRTRRDLWRFGTLKMDQVRDFGNEVSSYVSDCVDGAREKSKHFQTRIWSRAAE